MHWVGVGKRGGLERAVEGVEGQGGASVGTPGAQKEEQRPRGRPCRAGHSGAPAAVKRFQGCNASLWWWRPTFLKLALRKWSPAPAGWGSWRCTGLRRGGGHGVGDTGWGWSFKVLQQRETGKAWFGGRKIACSARTQQLK